MSAVTHEIATYKYELRRMRTSTVGLAWLSSAERLVCAIAFVDGAGPLPPLHHGPDGVVSFTLRAASLPVMVDMLRSEKPVYFTWWKEKGYASVSTAAEPVGEGELFQFAPPAARRKRAARPGKTTRRRGPPAA
jgi:hypothetical protein